MMRSCMCISMPRDLVKNMFPFNILVYAHPIRHEQTPYRPPSRVPGRVFIDNNGTNSKMFRELICLSFLQSLERRYNFFFAGSSGKVQRVMGKAGGRFYNFQFLQKSSYPSLVGRSLVGRQESSKVAFYSTFTDSTAHQRASKTNCTVEFPQYSDILVVSMSKAPELSRQEQR